MTKFNDVPYEDFRELISFLKFSDAPEENHNITKRLTRFIPNMTAGQSILLENIIQEIIENNIKEGEDDFNNFKKQFPELQFDPEGKQDLTNFEYYEVGL